MKRFDLNSRLSYLTKALFEGTPPMETSNPVVRASHAWRIISEQLRDLLGREIHRQWFKSVTPVLISENILILSTPSKQACHWINNHYQDLVDLLISFQDKKLSTFFVSQEDLGYHGSVNWARFIEAKEITIEEESSN